MIVAALLCSCFALLHPPVLAAKAQDDEQEKLERWWGKSPAEQSVNKRKALDEAIEQVKNPTNAENQEKAFYRLEVLGGEAVPALIEVITSPDRNIPPRARKDAIYAAGRIGREAAPAIPAITAALRDEDPDKRAAAAIALGRIGREAAGSVRDIVLLLKDAHPWVQQSAMRALKNINTAEAQMLLARHEGTLR